jgi:hypothetical protein
MHGASARVARTSRRRWGRGRRRDDDGAAAAASVVLLLILRARCLGLLSLALLAVRGLDWWVGGEA